MTTNEIVTKAAERIIRGFDDIPFPDSALHELATIITEEVVGPMMVEQARLIGRRDGERDADEAKRGNNRLIELVRERDELVGVLRICLHALDELALHHRASFSGTTEDEVNEGIAKAHTILERFPTH